jgi:hypothetical protein
VASATSLLFFTILMQHKTANSNANIYKLGIRYKYGKLRLVYKGQI